MTTLNLSEQSARQLDIEKRKLEARLLPDIKRIFRNISTDASNLYKATGSLPARELASNYDGDANKVAWINFASDEDLPYLIREGKYKNIYIFNFEIPAEDKHFLETRVIQASKLLDND